MADMPSPHAVDAEEDRSASRPPYEAPRVRLMTEREILAQFQITQSMAAWWTTGMC